MLRIGGFCALLLVMSCGGEGPSAPPVTPPPPPPAPAVLTSLTATLDQSAIQSGATASVTLSGRDQRGDPFTPVGVTWTSAQPEIAVSLGGGRFQGALVGTATITAASGSVTASVSLRVDHGAPTALRLARAAAGVVNRAVFTTQPVVELRDAAGNLATRDSSTVVSVAVSGGTLGGSATRAVVGGVATFSGLGVIAPPGTPVTLTFAAPGLSSIVQTSTVAPFTFGNGTRFVGTAIPSGIFRSLGSSSTSCYWARLRGTSGALGDIIANDLGTGPRVVEILPTDLAFESSGCANWTEFTGAYRSNPSAPITDGVYLVGTDIEPGTWSSNGSGSSCYWARLRNLRGVDEIIANNFGSAPAIVTVAATDVALEVSGCGTWSRVP